jgi:tartrate dehydrogenase/decarboxylase/D-malate dehydrogenase
MKSYRIALIPGDGIGKEVVPEALRVLEASGRRYDIEFRWGTFDVIVASNLFGDILSDLGPAAAGSIAIAPAANLNPEREFPSMFEPVHGSAPDIAGKGVANPIGQIASAAMMLSHLGEPKAAAAIEAAIETVLGEKGLRTRDLGGTASTTEMGEAIAAALR